MPIPKHKISAFPPEQRWHTVKKMPAEELFGYVAGKGVETLVHMIAGGHRPCVEWWTEGKAQCSFCEYLDLQEKAYLPFYLEPNWDRKVVIVSKTAWHDVQHFPFLSRFGFVKNAKEGQPAIFRRVSRPEDREPPPRKLANDGPQDISDYLQHLWGIDHRPHYKAKPAKKSSTKAQDKPEATGDHRTADEKLKAMETMAEWRRQIGLGGKDAA